MTATFGFRPTTCGGSRLAQRSPIGLVTCLYRGIAGPTLGSRLEAIGISTDFSAGVLAARQLEGGIRFGLGSTLAFRRRDLEAMGGFEAFADYLADDFQVGKRIAERGLKVKLSDVVVETFLPRTRCASLWTINCAGLAPYAIRGVGDISDWC